METRVFGLIDEGGFVMREDGSWRLDYCEVVLSDWLMRAIESDQVVTISNDYFRLRRPLERRLYEIARKHCGNQPKWHIGLATFNGDWQQCSSQEVPAHLRQIISDDHTPFYRIELTGDDLVIFRPRHTKTQIAPAITLPDWAEEKARALAREKGRDYHALRADWLAFAQAETAKGNPPKNAGAAFVAYCGKQDSLR